MKIILVGPPLIGKSFLINKLKQKGFKTFIADEFVNELYLKENPGFLIIKKEWGNTFLNEFGVDKRKLGMEIIKNPDILIRLGELINPLIEEHFNNNDYLFSEIPITISTKINLNYDKIILLKRGKDKNLENDILSSTRNLNKEFLQFISKKWNDEGILFDHTIEVVFDLDWDLEIELIIKKFNLKMN